MCRVNHRLRDVVDKATEALAAKGYAVTFESGSRRRIQPRLVVEGQTFTLPPRPTDRTEAVLIRRVERTMRQLEAGR